MLRLLTAFVCLPLLAAGPYEGRGEEMFRVSGAPGFALVVVEGGRSTILGYGNAKREPERALVRIGSLSKPLAGLVLERLAERGRVRLEDGLERWSPAGVRAPKVTLRQLATHTSGLARNAEGQGPKNAAPFTWPDEAARWRWVERQRPVAGRAALYSNVAYDLLGDALAHAGGKTYAELLRELVTGPMGMSETTATPSAAQCGRLMAGSAKEPTGPCAATTATAASGGLYSTPGDMARWLAALTAPGAKAPAILVRPSDLERVQGLDFAGPPVGIGLGWVFLAAEGRRPALIEKTGGGGGFLSYIAFTPERRAGVFVVMSSMQMGGMKQVIALVHELLADQDGAHRAQ